MKNIDTVIFDLDGTLLDTLDDLTASVNYCMDKYHCHIHSREEVRNMVGNGIYVLMERALPGGKQHPQYKECMADFPVHYKAHMLDHTRPFDGIHEMLTALKDSGYKLAIVSNRFDSAVKSLNQTFFPEEISVAIGESASIAKKPAPDTVFKAMEELHSRPESCIYIGDSEVDAATGKAARMDTILVSWGFRSLEVLKDAAPDWIVDSPDQILEIAEKSQQEEVGNDTDEKWEES